MYEKEGYHYDTYYYHHRQDCILRQKLLNKVEENKIIKYCDKWNIWYIHPFSTFCNHTLFKSVLVSIYICYLPFRKDI